MATEGALSSTGYMLHHLTHNASGKMQSIIDFSVINYDTIFFSILMLVVSLWLLRRAAKNATSGVPGKFQCAVEMLVDMVEEQSKSIVHGDRTFIAPCALTVFVWVVLMNAIDLIPVDLLPAIAGLFGIHYLRPLPTADLNGTMGISIAVLLAFTLLYPRIFAVTFDETFSRATGVRTDAYNTLIAALTAVTVVLGMRMMGALLISSLIIFLCAFPALSAMRVCKSFRAVVVCSAAISVVCFILGVLASYFWETPTGASVVIADLICFGLFSLLGKK